MAVALSFKESRGLPRAEIRTPQQIAQRLHCGDQTVRHVIRAFDAEGLGCLTQKSNRPHRDHSAFDRAGLKHLEEMVHRSLRDFGFEASQGTLLKLAQACFQERVVRKHISYETVRQGFHMLEIDWKTARHHITSHDPHYAAKTTS